MDALLEAVVQSPDDDAPRLVWADRIGGERGELVVLQCALADRKNELPTHVRRRYLRRARQLLDANGSKWASAEGAPSDATFARGFPARLRIEVDDLAKIAVELAERAPLVDDLELVVSGSVSAFAGPTAYEEWSAKLALAKKAFEAFPENRIRSISATPSIWTAGDWATSPTQDSFGDAFIDEIANRFPTLHRGLRSITLHAGAPTLEAALPNLKRLESLVALDAPFNMDSEDWSVLLDALPNLKTIGRLDGVPPHGKDLARFVSHPSIARMENLWLFPKDDDDLDLLATSANFESLETLHLVFNSIPSVSSLSRFVRSDHLKKNLRSLFIAGRIDSRTVETLSTQSSFAKRLRTLSFAHAAGNLRSSLADVLLQEFQSLESLHIQGTGELLRRANDLRIVIPDVR
jgi:uncharacterized protein (TIGR02996 family)